MSFAKKLLTVAAPAALLALSACATGFPAQVSRFEAMPPPQGQSFVIQPATLEDRGGLEFSHYADLVRRHLTELGYSEAPSAQTATLVVSLDYGVDNGRTEVVSYPGGYSRSFGYFGGWGRFGAYRPFYSRYGRHSPFYYGWNDLFWYSPYGFGYDDVRSYTVFTSYLDLDIRRTADGQSVFEGTAKARSRTDELEDLVPNLVEAMFTEFPGRSGETVRITVPPPPRDRN
ncbi:DUF4136 domain-containing protein [Sphingosinicella rhizophila]|uniref:DUF4136 domain-containing protein n=1 Tax=Sphingosinicella rhizophila TaxID=3050082 RepID=A0ABU3QAM4_9SPHN|nr:DUF4136 domain-containing protein [Sphingosinicella sp. GR2756]MDT9599995.1 DUF4136 domain-containing protein [Sphingosinicella sp. GR2756]